MIGMARFPVGNDDRAWAKLADFFREAEFVLAARLYVGVGNAENAAVTEAHEFCGLGSFLRARFDGSARAHLSGGQIEHSGLVPALCHFYQRAATGEFDIV